MSHQSSQIDDLVSTTKNKKDYHNRVLHPRIVNKYDIKFADPLSIINCDNTPYLILKDLQISSYDFLSKINCLRKLKIKGADYGYDDIIINDCKSLVDITTHCVYIEIINCPKLRSLKIYGRSSIIIDDITASSIEELYIKEPDNSYPEYILYDIPKMNKLKRIYFEGISYLDIQLLYQYNLYKIYLYDLSVDSIWLESFKFHNYQLRIKIAIIKLRILLRERINYLWNNYLEKVDKDKINRYCYLTNNKQML